MSDGSIASMNSVAGLLKLPVFEGLNPEHWLFRAEHYFELNISHRSTVICMEG